MVPTDPTDTVAYGQYLVLAAGCADCHTLRDDRGQEIGEPFAGGAEFAVPGFGISRSANILPDNVTGIGGWTRQDFVDRFKATTAAEYRQMEVSPGDFNTVMPWWEYGGMTPGDLGAIYDFLRTVPAATNAVMTLEAPPAEE